MLPINTFIKPREYFIYSKEIIEMSHKRKRNSVLKKRKKKEKKNPNRAQKDISSKAWRSIRHLTDVSKCPSCLWNALNSYHFHMADIASIKVGASFSRATFEIQLETYFYPQGKKKKKKTVVVHSLCKHILQKYQPPFSKRIASFRWKLSLLGLNIISFLVLPLPMKILVAYQEARSNSQWKEDAAMLFCISNNFQLWKNTLHIQWCSFLWQSSCMQSVRAVIWSSAVHALAFESFFFLPKDAISHFYPEQGRMINKTFGTL